MKRKPTISIPLDCIEVKAANRFVITSVDRRRGITCTACNRISTKDPNKKYFFVYYWHENGSEALAKRASLTKCLDIATAILKFNDKV